VKLPGDVNLELKDCAIAVFDNQESLVAATAELDGKKYEYFVLEGAEGQEALQPPEGPSSILKRLAAAFGDELRIIDKLDQSMADGDVVVIVRAVDDQAAVIELLTDHGGRFLWQFREWTFNSAGSAESANAE
jgi:hypothetical protein